MDQRQITRILTHVVGSYVSRELDRKWLDKFMETSVGERLKGLSSSEKHALEFLSYLFSGYIVQNNPNPSAFRVFVNQAVSDIPTEIAKRMMSKENAFNGGDVQAALLDLSDEEILEVFASASETKDENGVKSRTQDENTAIGQIADVINNKRASFRRRSWRRTSNNN